MDRISSQSPSVLGGQSWWPQDWVSAFSGSVGHSLSLDQFTTESESAGLTTSISKSKTMVLNREMVAWSLQARDEILPQLQKITRGLVHDWGKNLLVGGHEDGCFVSSDAAIKMACYNNVQCNGQLKTSGSHVCDRFWVHLKNVTAQESSSNLMWGFCYKIITLCKNGPDKVSDNPLSVWNNKIDSNPIDLFLKWSPTSSSYTLFPMIHSE